MKKQFEIRAEVVQENVKCDLWWKGIVFQILKFCAKQKILN